MNRHRLHFLSLVLTLLALPFVVENVHAQDWPQMLGPNRDGISTETGLLTEWPADGPKEVWRAKGGVGMSGLAVSNGVLVTVYHKSRQQTVAALDAKTGKPIWETPVAPEYRNPMGNGTRATPAIEGDRVFVFTGEGVLAALSISDGKLLWSADTIEQHAGKEAEYGMASSPLVHGENVIITVGAPKATVAAYDIQTGKLAWTAGSRDPAGYSSPVVRQLNGKPTLLAYTGASLLAVDPKTGASQFRYPYVTNYECNIALPLIVDGNVFISSGENHGSALLSLKPTAAGVQLDEVWTSQGRDSVLRTEWQTAILHKGNLYGMDNVGGAGPITHLTCIDAATGKRRWQKARFGKGNFIFADGKLFMTTMRGELVIAKASPDSYQELGRKTILGATRQAPSLANGMLYMRDDSDIVCVDVRK